jgi:hypothetical protein
MEEKVLFSPNCEFPLEYQEFEADGSFKACKDKHL